MNDSPNDIPDDIPEYRLHDLLAARIDGVVPGVAPTERVLAGARRRRIRTRVVTGTAGVLAVAGAVTAVAVEGGPGGRTAAAGQSPAARSTTSTTATAHVPVLTQQLGLAAGQAPAPELRGMRVLMSGTVDGRPWQLYGATQVDPPEQGMWTDHFRPDPGKHAYCFMFATSIGGKERSQGGGGCGETDPLSDPRNGPIRILSGGTDLNGSDGVFAVQGVVTPNVAKLVWTGADGFREETTPLLTPLSGMPFFFMAGPTPGQADKLTAYDAAGKVVRSASFAADPPEGLGMLVVTVRPTSSGPSGTTSPTIATSPTER